MTKKIFRSTFFVAAVVLLCSVGIIVGVLYGYFEDVQRSQLRDELRIAAVGTELEGVAFLDALEARDYRLTWIARDGTVLYDTAADPASMENHAQRTEIHQAMTEGSGSASRHSQTMLERTDYEAVRLTDGSVLRISRNERTLLILTVGMLHPICVVIAIAMVLSFVLADRMARRIVEPLNTLDLERPLENDVYEEISPLLRRINRQHIQIDSQMRILRRKTDEFDQITRSMEEGLILLDSEGTILTINPMAQELFGTGLHCVGKSILTIDPSEELRDALNDALDHGRGLARTRRRGRDYRMELSRIASEGHVVGAVLLILDVTEALNAEKTRREFSANVSHELKTPLQSIIGSAELLEHGLVKPEDTLRFIERIRREAVRLVNLIEDIIRLSQLDEGAAFPRENVDLALLSRETAATLAQAAASGKITLEVEGESCCVTGVRRVLQEMVYNLCDNAIKYNHPGGSVTVTVGMASGRPFLRVADTGIGIPPEHQDRVFERFYRVDKSHSRQSGGTGLGLSIVKHGVQLHNGKLELNSTPGRGTEITISF